VVANLVKRVSIAVYLEGEENNPVGGGEKGRGGSKVPASEMVRDDVESGDKGKEKRSSEGLKWQGEKEGRN